MAHTLLGIVERFGPVKSGPPARLRPLFQASADRSRWVTPEEEFPNSGVVSWWEPPPDAAEQKVWTFQPEPSWSFDPANEHHDFFKVKGAASPALELIDLPGIGDLENARAFLVEEGLPLEQCASKRLVYRDGSGFMVGPLDLSIREGRFYLEERDAPVPLYQSSEDLGLGEWKCHRFLPPEALTRRVGEVDFSSNIVFLKHVLRDIKEMPPGVLDDAKLTKKLIAQYTYALEKMSLGPLQTQRLKRLRKLADRASVGITLGDQAVTDLLSIPAVRNAISTATEQAVHDALNERRSALEKLSDQRTTLEGEVAGLQAEVGRLRGELASTKEDQEALLADFDSRVEHKLKEAEKNATAFLADVAVLRAALSITAAPTASARPAANGLKLPDAQRLSADQVVNAIRECSTAAGLGCILPTILLSSWASGYVPILFGVMARDVIDAARESLFGGCVYRGTLGPAMFSATDLLGVTVASSFDVRTVHEFVGAAGATGELALLVFDNINLSQLDSLLLPLLRSYTTFHGEVPTSTTPAAYPTPLGMWPANVLIAGILIDSPLALPMSRELWTCSTFIDASSKRACEKSKATGHKKPNEIRRLPYQAWAEWLRMVEHTDASDTRVIATYLGRTIENNPLFKRMTLRLAMAIDRAGMTMDGAKKARLLVEMFVPYLLSLGLAPAALIKDAPVDISIDDGSIDMVTLLFEKWGLEAR